MATADLSPSISNAPSPGGAPLQSRLQLLARRRNALKMRHALVRAAIPGVIVASLGVLAYKLHLIADGPAWAPIAIIGASLFWGARNGWLERRGNFAAARDADAALDLDDRLSSALAFVAPEEIKRQQRVQGGATRLERVRNTLMPRFAVSTSPTALNTNLVPALVSDASQRATLLDPKQVYPTRFDRAHKILAVATVIFLGACLMPDIPLFLSKEEKKERTVLMQQGEKLLTVSKQVRKQESPKAEEVQRLNRKLEKLAQKMARGRMTKRAALTEIGELKKELQKAKQQQSQGEKNSGGLPQIPEAMREAPLQSQVGKDVQKSLLDNKWEEAAKKLEETADRLDKGQMSEKEKQQAADDLDKVAKQLRQRGGQANEQAAKQLEQAAKQLRQPQGEQQQGQQNGQQSQQNQNQQNSQQSQQQQGQQGQNQQQNGQQQGQQQQSGQNQQNGQQGQQNQQQQKNGQGQQQGSQGQQQQQQGGQQNQQQQGAQGNQQNQGQQGQQQQGSQGQQSQGQQGQQSQQGGAGQQPQSGGQQGDNGASNALRDMANGLRQGGSQGNSGNLGEMLDKLREAEGNANGSQAGQGQPKSFSPNGQNGSPSPSQTQNLKPGQLRPTDGRGNNGGGAGLGPRDQSTGNQGGSGVSKFKKPNTGDKRRYEDVWSDRLPKTRSKLDRIKGKWGGQGEVDQLPTRGEAKGGQAKTPYYEVYESYKRDAEDAVSREAVPPAYKDSVKNYFESLKP